MVLFLTLGLFIGGFLFVAALGGTASYDDGAAAVVGVAAIALVIGGFNSFAYMIAQPESPEKDFTVSQIVQEAQDEGWNGLVLTKGEYPMYVNNKGKSVEITQTEKFDPWTFMIDEQTDEVTKYREVTAGDLETVQDKGGKCKIFGVDKLDGRCYRVGNAATIELTN